MSEVRGRGKGRRIGETEAALGSSLNVAEGCLGR